jgi:hypothetical protein
MKKHLSLAVRIQNAHSSQRVENVKARHAYHHGRADPTTEWTEFWSKSEERGWSHHFGLMKGFDQVWWGLVSEYDRLAFTNWLGMIELYPEVGGKDPRPLMETALHTLVTDVIEVADDGMSARGSFMTPGLVFSTLTPNQKKFAGVLWERYGSDFVFEDGDWKYLNEQVSPDILSELDQLDWAQEDWKRVQGADAWNMPPVAHTVAEDVPGVEKHAGSGTEEDRTQVTHSYPPVTISGWHEPWSILQPPQDDSPWPEPYETMDEEHRYNKSPGK